MGFNTDGGREVDGERGEDDGCVKELQLQKFPKWENEHPMTVIVNHQQNDITLVLTCGHGKLQKKMSSLGVQVNVK